MKDNFLYLGSSNSSHRYHMGHTLDGRLCEDRWRKDAAYSKLPYFPTKIGEYPIGDMLDWNIRPHVLEDPYITSPKDEGEDLRSPEIYDVDKCAVISTTFLMKSYGRLSLVVVAGPPPCYVVVFVVRMSCRLCSFSRGLYCCGPCPD